MRVNRHEAELHLPIPGDVGEGGSGTRDGDRTDELTRGVGDQNVALHRPGGNIPQGVEVEVRIA